MEQALSEITADISMREFFRILNQNSMVCTIRDEKSKNHITICKECSAITTTTNIVWCQSCNSSVCINCSIDCICESEKICKNCAKHYAQKILDKVSH